RAPWTTRGPTATAGPRRPAPRPTADRSVPRRGGTGSTPARPAPRPSGPPHSAGIPPPLSGKPRGASGAGPAPRGLPLVPARPLGRPPSACSQSRSTRCHSAVSGVMLCKSLQRFAAVIGTDPVDDFGRRQWLVRLDDGSLAVDPLRLDPVQP